MDESRAETRRAAREAAAERAAIAVRPEFRHGADGLAKEKVFELKGVDVNYSGVTAVKDITMDVGRKDVTALIGPSGCGKSTLLRCLNRMNDLIPGAEVEGELLYHGEDLYGPTVDPVAGPQADRHGLPETEPVPEVDLRQRRLRPARPRRQGRASTRRSRRRCAARRSGTRSRTASTSNAFGLSGGQQQRLCIARCIAVEPDVILMDEPCSALDPISTGKIEDLMIELKERVLDRDRHPQHAAGGAGLRPHRVPDGRARRRPRRRAGAAWSSSTRPRRSSPIPADQRTEDYVSGKVG